MIWVRTRCTTAKGSYAAISDQHELEIAVHLKRYRIDLRSEFDQVTPTIFHGDQVPSFIAV